MQQETIYITLTSDYVQNWGFWEASRELIQNMIDCEKGSLINRNDGQLFINTWDGAIPKEMLMLGNSSKRDDDTKTGMHGEGACLAMLVLCRTGYGLNIKNGLDKWDVSIDTHPQLNAECLSVTITEDYFAQEPELVSIHITGLTTEDHNELEEKYLDDGWFDYFYEAVKVDYQGSKVFTLEDRDTQAIFVNGLYVNDLPKDYRFSYSFTPDRIKLDRDRSSVNSWDMQFEVAKLLEEAEAYELMVKLSEEKAPDLHDYYTPTTWMRGGECESKPASESLKRLSGKRFKEKHGDYAIAINSSLNQEKRMIFSKRAQAYGFKAIEVPKNLYAMLPDELKKLPDYNGKKEFKKASQVIEDFINDNKKHMRSKALKAAIEALDDIKLIES